MPDVASPELLLFVLLLTLLFPVPGPPTLFSENLDGGFILLLLLLLLLPVNDEDETRFIILSGAMTAAMEDPSSFP